jgi:hypothetical protein
MAPFNVQMYAVQVYKYIWIASATISILYNVQIFKINKHEKKIIVLESNEVNYITSSQ